MRSKINVQKPRGLPNMMLTNKYECTKCMTIECIKS